MLFCSCSSDPVRSVKCAKSKQMLHARRVSHLTTLNSQMDKMDQRLMPTTTAEQLDAQQLQRLCRLCLGPDQDISVHDIATRTEPKSPPSTYAELAESVLDIRVSFSNDSLVR